jgi:hypothetical protein
VANAQVSLTTALNDLNQVRVKPERLATSRVNRDREQRGQDRPFGADRLLGPLLGTWRSSRRAVEEYLQRRHPRR